MSVAASPRLYRPRTLYRVEIVSRRTEEVLETIDGLPGKVADDKYNAVMEQIDLRYYDARIVVSGTVQ